MSKSKGNIITPQALIKDMGTDALRLWVASNDFGSDAIVSPELLKNVKEVNRKIRNTCRFLLSNLYDFDPQLNCARLEKFSAIDKYALFELNKFSKKLQTAYTETRFTLVFSELAEFCTKFLSSFYLDIIKDRLYCEHKQGTLRRAAQTVSWVILDALTKLMAPVLSFTAEQISDFYQKSKASSIHLQNFTNLDFTNSMNLDISAWDKVLDLRSKVLKSIEDKRETGDIKHSLEAFVKINLPKELLDSLNKILENADTTMQNLDQFLMELFIVSKVEIVNSGELKIEVTRAEGEKCPRCWKYDNSGHEDSLCTRCQKVF